MKIRKFVTHKFTHPHCNRDIRQSIAHSVPSLSILEYAHSRGASDDRTPFDPPKEILFL